MNKSIQIETRADFSKEKILNIKNELVSCLVGLGSDFSVVTTGSFARNEASDKSDLDFFLIHGEPLDSEKTTIISGKINDSITPLLKKSVGDSNTFGVHQCIDEMLNNIGGTGDSNENLTRRVLFLLEGRCLWNNDKFSDFRNRLLSTYIKDRASEHHLPKFLLNDVIRYYRTICTDFEYKTYECDKTWGLRNIKLMFSRKLLYFSGVVAIADTCHRTPKEKIKRLSYLFDMTPIERVRHICGEQASKNLFEMYSEFLEEISNPEVRAKLDAVQQENSSKCEEFRKLKNDGHRFSFELTNMLRKTFDASHPIHHSLIL